MASINFSQFTVDNGAIRDLNELLFTSAFNDPDLESIMTTMTGVVDGKKLGYVDRMGDVGEPSTGCNPTYSNFDITGFEKTWDLGKWAIPKKICYTDLEDTIAKYGMNAGTERANLQDTPYWDKVLTPLLSTAIREMMWRLLWFGDKSAKNCTSAGVDTVGGGAITDTVDPKLLKSTDGFWKRLQAIIAANASQKTTIAANSQTTAALQKSKIREEGVAVSIVDDMLTDADSRIFDYDDHAIFMTNSLFKALRNDLVNKYGKYTMPVEQVMSGVVMSEYDGHKVIAIDIWDRMIKKYFNNGTKLDAPHRAVLCSPKNLFAGTSDKDIFADLVVKFDDRQRDNFIYAESDLGTLIGEDDLVQVAI